MASLEDRMVLEGDLVPNQVVKKTANKTQTIAEHTRGQH